MLAERFGTTEQTVYKGKHRGSVQDRSHRPHRLQSPLTPAQEAVAVVRRKTLLVSRDDLLAVVREFLKPEVSRSGLDRCLRRHGVGNLRDAPATDPRAKHRTLKACEPGYLPVDVRYLPQMADEPSRRDLFVAIDRATRRVFLRVFKSKTAANARRFLRDLERACPIRIRTVLTDNGKEFTDRLSGLRKRTATGPHGFDQLCAGLGIDPAWPRRSLPKPTAWSSASTAGSKRCCKATTSGPARRWKPRCTVTWLSTTSNRLSQLRAARRPCRR